MTTQSTKRKPKLSMTLVDGLEPRDREYVEWCGELKGFGVRVYPQHPKTGEVRKTFIAQYDLHGKTRKVKIGTFGTWTVDQARKDAKLILADAQRGIDKAEAKAKERREMTVSQLCDEYVEACEKKLIRNSKGEAKKASTLATDKGRIERHIKKLLGSKKIGTVTKRDITQFLHDIADGRKIAVDEKTGKHGRAIVTGGKGAATRTVRLLGGIFSYAVDKGYLETNPRFGVTVYADGKGERFLSPDEFARLAEALTEAETVGLPWIVKEGPKAKHTPKKGGDQREVIAPHAIAAIRLLMFTGCRAGEILKLKWAHVDEANHTLHLADSKTGAKKVMIGEAALQILKGIPRVEGNPYVIAGEAKGKPRSDLKRPWARITEYAGLNVDAEGSPKALRLHDLRHSFASTGIAAGMTLPMIGKLLGHASPQTTARYTHLAEDAARHAISMIDGAIAGFTGQTAEVIPFKRSVGK